MELHWNQSTAPLGKSKLMSQHWKYVLVSFYNVWTVVKFFFTTVYSPFSTFIGWCEFRQTHLDNAWWFLVSLSNFQPIDQIVKLIKPRRSAGIRARLYIWVDLGPSCLNWTSAINKEREKQLEKLRLYPTSSWSISNHSNQQRMSPQMLIIKNVNFMNETTTRMPVVLLLRAKHIYIGDVWENYIYP